MKTRQELIEGCKNEHDRKLMIRELDRFSKVKKKSNILFGLAIASGSLGYLLIKSGFEWGIFGFVIAPTLLIFAQINILRRFGGI